MLLLKMNSICRRPLLCKIMLVREASVSIIYPLCKLIFFHLPQRPRKQINPFRKLTTVAKIENAERVNNESMIRSSDAFPVIEVKRTSSPISSLLFAFCGNSNDHLI